MTDLLLALVGCGRGLGAPLAVGTPHSARTDWRSDCSTCWVRAILGVVLWGGAVACIVILVTSG